MEKTMQTSEVRIGLSALCEWCGRVACGCCYRCGVRSKDPAAHRARCEWRQEQERLAKLLDLTGADTFDAIYQCRESGALCVDGAAQYRCTGETVWITDAAVIDLYCQVKREVA